MPVIDGRSDRTTSASITVVWMDVSGQVPVRRNAKQLIMSGSKNGMKELISSVLVSIHHAFFPTHHQHRPIIVGGIYCLFFFSFFLSFFLFAVWHRATTSDPCDDLTLTRGMGDLGWFVACSSYAAPTEQKLAG